MSILAVPFAACTDDIITPDMSQSVDDETLEDVYTLNFMVTLDDMGSAISTRADYNPASQPDELKKWENYIDPERFRVLFFDMNNKFIFESKNRWVKSVDANDYFSSWLVSVPFGPFGNDSYGEGKEYNWDDIHDKLTGGQFKVAILANRPAELQYPGDFMDAVLQLPQGVFKNDGPQWGPHDAGVKSLLDLQHAQYDIIYADKGNHSGGAKGFTELAYYDFIMGDIKTDRPTLGSAIHWVSFAEGDKKIFGSSESTTEMRITKRPSADHPIPMYGVQVFDPIPAHLWKKGTPFDISNEPADAFPNTNYNTNSISLLRSCVRLDLKIPKSVKSGQKPSTVVLWYSNIYSRCEPMDTWTPTDLIWKDHGNGCEWEKIRDHGLVVKSPYNKNSGATSKNEYQSIIQWFYGAWTDPALGAENIWKFERLDGSKNAPAAESANRANWIYPHIMNSCIQRNKVINLANADVTELFDDRDKYWHYVVYTGERNMNDANSLYEFGKNPYIESFMVSWDNNSFYCIPLLQYGVNTATSSVSSVFGPHSVSGGTYAAYSKGSWPAALDTYINDLPAVNSKYNWPYPLVRNHIYAFTLKGTKSSDNFNDLIINSDVVRTPEINFKDKLKARKLSVKSPVFKVNENKELIMY